MDILAFTEGILDPLETRVPGLDGTRVWTAYQDVANIVAVIARLEEAIGGRWMEELQAQGKDDEATEVYWLDGYVVTLHKALIEFANLYMVVLLHELYRRPDKEITILALAKSPVARRFKRAVLHRAYCLYVYRNKVIVHHDVPRALSTVIDRTNGQRWLNPLPHGIMDGVGIDRSDLRQLMELQRRYAAAPAAAGEAIPMESATALFYTIPGPCGDKASQDRALIDGIVERVGCRSMTIPEIVTTVDDFAREITRVAPLSTSSSSA